MQTQAADLPTVSLTVRVTQSQTPCPLDLLLPLPPPPPTKYLLPHTPHVQQKPSCKDRGPYQNLQPKPGWEPPLAALRQCRRLVQQPALKVPAALWCQEWPPCPVPRVPRTAWSQRRRMWLTLSFILAPLRWCCASTTESSMAGGSLVFCVLCSCLIIINNKNGNL